MNGQLVCVLVELVHSILHFSLLLAGSVVWETNLTQFRNLAQDTINLGCSIYHRPPLADWIKRIGLIKWLRVSVPDTVLPIAGQFLGHMRRDRSRNTTRYFNLVKWFTDVAWGYCEQVIQDIEGIGATTRLLSDNLLELSICIRTHVKTIKPMVNLESTNDPDTLNQAQE